MIADLAFRKADANDIEPLVWLINSAYRGESSRLGWTTEADLLDGRRTDAEHLHQLMSQEDSVFLLCQSNQQILGSVNLQKAQASMRLSMLAVNTAFQGKGIGQGLLAFAEDQARIVWSARCLEMAVIASRQELIEYYERRGYTKTGMSEPFPENPALWQAKVRGLRLLWLEKRLDH